MRFVDSMAAVLSLAAAIAISAPLSAQTGFGGPGRYEITNVRSGKVIDLDRNDRTTVLQYSPRNTENQFWNIRAAEPGFWFIRNSMTGVALEAMSTANSTPVRGMPFTGSPSQQWDIHPAKDGNYLITNRLGKTLDIPNGTEREGALIQTYEINSNPNQRFMFRRVGDIVGWEEGRGPGGPGGPGGDRPYDRDRDHDGDRGMRRDVMEGDGACFYHEPEFGGRAFCVHLGEEVRRLPDDWVDAFQSVRFFGHVQAVEIFGQANFLGRRARIDHDRRDLDHVRAENGEPLRHFGSVKVY